MAWLYEPCIACAQIARETANPEGAYSRAERHDFATGREVNDRLASELEVDNACAHAKMLLHRLPFIAMLGRVRSEPLDRASIARRFNQHKVTIRAIQ
jgi:hypothetical protein